MVLEHSVQGGFTVIRCCEDRLDALIAVQFKDRFREMMGQDGSGVVLDLTEVQFMDSSGLGAVVAVYKLVGRERNFALVGLSSAVERVLKLTRMDSVFSIYPTTADAVAENAGAADATRKAS